MSRRAYDQRSAVDKHKSRALPDPSSLLSHLVRALAPLALVVCPLSAQSTFDFVPRMQPELRFELGQARTPSALVMTGANIPLGYYIRAGAAVGAGGLWRDARAQVTMRADVTARMLLDPFAENRWGPYAGGGLTVRRDAWDRPVAGLLMVLGVEGRRGKRWVPSGEVALGEGARVAVVLRKARTNGR